MLNKIKTNSLFISHILNLENLFYYIFIPIFLNTYWLWTCLIWGFCSIYYYSFCAGGLTWTVDSRIVGTLVDGSGILYVYFKGLPIACLSLCYRYSKACAYLRAAVRALCLNRTSSKGDNYCCSMSSNAGLSSCWFSAGVEDESI